MAAPGKPIRALVLAWLAPLPWPAAAAAAPAEPQPPVITLEATIGVSDRGTLAAAGDDRGDVPLVLRPRLRAVRAGPLAWEVDASTTLTGSALGRAPLRARPDIDARLGAGVVDGLLTIDASARLRQVQADPFGPRPDATRPGNERTEQSYQLGPALHAQPWPGGLLLARQTRLVTLGGAGARGTMAGSRTELTLAQVPAPLGASLTLSRLASRTRGMASSQIVLETGRVSLDARPDPEFEFGADAGADRTRTVQADRTDPLWALHAAWRPSERTLVSTLAENRFFGHGGQLTLTERMPWMSLQWTVARLPTLVLQSAPGGGGDLRAALDAVLTTRVPDPSARATLVETLLTTLALDTGAFGPVDAQTSYPQIQDRNELAWTFLSARTSVTVEAYDRSFRVLRRRGEPLAAGVAVADDNRQRGLSLQAARRLAPTLSADILLRVARIEGLAASDGRRSTDGLVRAWLTRQLSPRTSLTWGGQWQVARGTQAGDGQGRRVLLFVGLIERL